jgi:hypothetical protein
MPRARIGTRPQTPLPLAIASLCLASIAYTPARRDTAANPVMATSVPIVALARPICSITYSLPCHACSRLTPAKSIICRLFAPSSFCFLFSACASNKLSSRLPLAHPSFAMPLQGGVLMAHFGLAEEDLDAAPNTNEICGRIRKSLLKSIQLSCFALHSGRNRGLH